MHDDKLCAFFGRAEKHIRYILYGLRHFAAIEDCEPSERLSEDVGQTLDFLTHIKIEVPNEVWKRNLSWLLISAIKFNVDDFNFVEIASAARHAEGETRALDSHRQDEEDDTWHIAFEVMRDVV